MTELIVEKRCSHCKIVKQIEEFHKDRAAPSGLTYSCKACQVVSHKKYSRTVKGQAAQKRGQRSARALAWRSEFSGSARERAYKKRWRKTPLGKRACQLSKESERTKYPERQKARDVITMAVRTGHLPRAGTLLCNTCDKPAKEYHHHLGYAREHRLNVIPLCRGCHASVR